MAHDLLDAAVLLFNLPCAPDAFSDAELERELIDTVFGIEADALTGEQRDAALSTIVVLTQGHRSLPLLRAGLLAGHKLHGAE